MNKLLWLLAAAAVPARAADPIHGRDAFRVCSACHSGAPGAIGPNLEGILGRPAASLPSFRYSGPLKHKGIIWTPDNLQAFLVDPQSVVPGNRMPFSGTTSEIAADIVAYLTTLDAHRPEP